MAPFSVSGKGLHTGMMINAEFLPAPENHGYKIQRTDIEGEPIINCLAEQVVQTSRGTVIANGNVTVSTIEHAMAALYAAGIDNGCGCGLRQSRGQRRCVGADTCIRSGGVGECDVCRRNGDGSNKL